MRNVFLTAGWIAATIAPLGAVVVRADNQPNSKNRSNDNSGRRNDNSGRSDNKGGRSDNNSGQRKNSGSGEKPGAAGGSGKIINKAGPGQLNPGNNSNPGKLIPGDGKKGSGGGKKGSGSIGGGNNKKVPDKSAWKNSNKDGWHKDGWNNKFNSQHRNRRHGYWNNGIWIAPWIIANNRPWIYLQPAQPIASGQKWLGVTFEPYDGGGAYVTGIYEGSPAQQIGIEVGDVIVSLDGVDATQLGSVIQASDGNVVLQVLSGRTGELVELPVNLIR